MNKYKLIEIMKRHHDRQEDLAKAIGISRTRFGAKINGRAFFTQPEIFAIKTRYLLSAEQLDEIFFS